jgi:hypothetical protein
MVTFHTAYNFAPWPWYLSYSNIKSTTININKAILDITLKSSLSLGAHANSAFGHFQNVYHCYTGWSKGPFLWSLNNMTGRNFIHVIANWEQVMWMKTSNTSTPELPVTVPSKRSMDQLYQKKQKPLQAHSPGWYNSASIVRCGFCMSPYTLTWNNHLSVASILHKIFCKTWGFS